MNGQWRNTHAESRAHLGEANCLLAPLRAEGDCPPSQAVAFPISPLEPKGPRGGGGVRYATLRCATTDGCITTSGSTTRDCERSYRRIWSQCYLVGPWTNPTI